MKIIILGAGQVGTTLAANLVSEDNDITLVDNESQPVSYTHLDVYKRQVLCNEITTFCILFTVDRITEVI